MFSYISPEKRVPADHPLRPLRKIVDEILKEMSPKFQKLYSKVGRPSIAPERLLRSLLLQHLLFGTQRANADRTATVQPIVPVVRRDGDGPDGVEPRRYTARIGSVCWNEVRLRNRFSIEVLERCQSRYMSDEHFTVDGTMIGKHRKQS